MLGENDQKKIVKFVQEAKKVIEDNEMPNFSSS
jgi:hypothetical protein